MDARTNLLGYEVGRLRSEQRRNPSPDRASKIAALEAELDAVNFQFHAARRER